MSKINYILFITERCNLKCKYCEHKQNNKDMSIQTFDILFERILKSKDEFPSITLFGGEPLLNPYLINYIFERINSETSKKISVNLTTNLFFLSESLLSLFVKNKDKVKISVSIDGDKETTNINRGEFAYENAISNFNELNFNGVEVSANLVINIENLGKLSYNVKHLYTEGFREFSLFLNFNDANLILDERNHLLLDEQLAKILEFYYSSKIKRIRLERTRLDVYDDEKEQILPCGGKNIYIGVDGDLFNCTRHKYTEGEKNVDLQSIDTSKCLNCKYKKYCCTCFGNKSFLFNKDTPNIVNLVDVDINEYHEKYCKFMSRYLERVFKHWDFLKENEIKEEITTINVNNKIVPLVINPKYIDFGSDEDVYIILNSAREFTIKGDNKVFAIINTDESGVRELCIEKGITIIN